jgi:DNA-binding LytR/AlgR family response regulator
MNYSAVIIDDDSLAVELMEKLLNDYCPEVEDIRGFTNENKAIAYLSTKQADIIFLDVAMRNMSGFDLLDLIPHNDSLVVIVSGSEVHSIKALRNQVFDYILKPASPESLGQLMKRIRQLHTEKAAVSVNSAKDVLVVNRHDKVYFLPYSDIIKIEANGPYSRIHTPEEVIQTSKTMLHLQAKLPPDRFVKISRSMIVNAACIKMIKKNNDGTAELILNTGEKIMLSKQLKDRLVWLFNSAKE